MYRSTKKTGFTLLELTITLVVGVILMMGMLPLIRIAANRGVEMQLQMRDVVELQSLVERMGAWTANQNSLTDVKNSLGDTAGTIHTIPDLGEFYLHSARFVDFDASKEIKPTTNSVLLEIKVSLTDDGSTPNGASLTKIFKENDR
jgi:prepilin-type N-terminal cleavage/methylation domain-containing protein